MQFRRPLNCLLDRDAQIDIIVRALLLFVHCFLFFWIGLDCYYIPRLMIDIPETLEV